MAKLSGTVADRYRVLERIGAGAFGEVYSAEDLTLTRTVALKRLRLEAMPEGAQQDDGRRRFLLEAKVAARLRHPNIVIIHDVVSTPEHSLMVLELIEGETLEDVLAREGRLDPQRTVDIIAPAAEALDYAHREGVIHRDIKPGNVMIDRDGQAKVADFGIAKIETGATLTNTGYLLGTPKFMSPEQARGQTLDGRSDLFSLGCVLYQCLSGRLAFDGDSVTAVLLAIVSDEPAPLDDLEDLIPAGLRAVLERSLAKDREDRFATGLRRMSPHRLRPSARPRTPPGPRHHSQRHPDQGHHHHPGSPSQSELSLRSPPQQQKPPPQPRRSTTSTPSTAAAARSSTSTRARR